MARTALSALDELERLGVDSFLFISDEADPRAEKGGANAAEMVTANAAPGLGEAAFGLENASLAPDAPFGPGGSPGFGVAIAAAHSQAGFSSSGGDVEIGAFTLLEPPLFAAKGGEKGPPPGKGPGSDDGGTGDGGNESPTTQNYFSGSSDNAEGYDIWIEFIGDLWSGAEDLMQAFKDAADYLTMVITEDIGGDTDVNGTYIDDLYVSAELMDIDGTGGVLGRAGPTAVWRANDLTATGLMEFDIADAQSYFDLGLWDDIVMHELMHVLGFGTLWEYGSHDLVDGNDYIGQSGLDAFQAIYPTATSIPVEEDGGRGTAGGHWDEGNYPRDLRDPIKLDNELMTGFIDSDGDPLTDNDNYLSAFSVMSLQDLGYAVAYQDYPYDDTNQDYVEPDALVV